MKPAKPAPSLTDPKTSQPSESARSVEVSMGGFFGGLFKASVEQAQLADEAAAIEKTMPTAADLALVAATLAQGRRVDNESGAGFALQALLLFEACQEHIKSEAMRRASATLAEQAYQSKQASIPMPGKFPASFDDFLRLIVKGKSEADKVCRFRTYAEELLFQAVEHRPCTLDDREAVMKWWRGREFGEIEWNGTAGAFLKWDERHSKELRVERAKAGAKARHNP